MWSLILRANSSFQHWMLRTLPSPLSAASVVAAPVDPEAAPPEAAPPEEEAPEPPQAAREAAIMPANTILMILFFITTPFMTDVLLI